MEKRLACKLRWGLLGPLLSATLVPTPAHACSYVPKRQSPAEIRKEARQAFSKANAIIDAEVTSPMLFGDAWKEGLTPIAYLKVLHVWKGNPPDLVPVVYTTSCDIGLLTKGEKVRLLLTGAGAYRAEQSLNGFGISNPTLFLREIDRLVGYPKGPGFTEVPGAPPPPQ
jgi:hypothetical protein